MENNAASGKGGGGVGLISCVSPIIRDMKYVVFQRKVSLSNVLHCVYPN